MLCLCPNKGRQQWHQTSQGQKCVTSHGIPFNKEIRANQCPRLKGSFSMCSCFVFYRNSILCVKCCSLMLLGNRYGHGISRQEGKQDDTNPERGQILVHWYHAEKVSSASCCKQYTSLKTLKRTRESKRVKSGERCWWHTATKSQVNTSCKLKRLWPGAQKSRWATGWKEVMSRASGSCKDKHGSADIAPKLLPQANRQHATAALICFANGHIQCIFQKQKGA